MSDDLSTWMAARSGQATAALILGLVAIVLSPVAIGIFPAIIAVILGMKALPGLHRAKAVTGLLLGGLAVLISINSGFYGIRYGLREGEAARQEELARQTAVRAHDIVTAMYSYMSENDNWMPPHLASLIKTSTITPDLLRDPRVPELPMPAPAPGISWDELKRQVDAHSDFYYVGVDSDRLKLSVIRDPNDFIVLYDKGTTGGKRVVAFASGFVKTFAPGSAELRQIVMWRCNPERDGLLPLLPQDLDGPPLTGAAGRMIRIALWASESGFPRSLSEVVIGERIKIDADLAPSYLLDPDLVRPRDAPTFVPTTMGVDAYSDFCYSGAGLPLKGSPDTILLYEKYPSGQAKLVAFADGSLRKVSTAELPGLVAKNNKMRGELGLSLLPSDLNGPPQPAPDKPAGFH